jgi:hypothetical protein
MIVPNTALMTTTISDAITVSFSAATDWAPLTASQKVPIPPFSDWSTTAASGSSTITLR